MKKTNNMNNPILITGLIILAVGFIIMLIATIAF